MGARGPAPKPLELRVLEGNRGHRPLDTTDAFRPETGLPSPPKHLSAEARKAWRRLSPELLRYNLLSQVDRDGFAMLCQTVGRLEMLERSIAARQQLLMDQGRDPADALMDSTPNGLRVQHAIYQILNREQSKLSQMLAMFGLRPDARARVTAGVRAQLKLWGGTETTPAGDGLPTGFTDF